MDIGVTSEFKSRFATSPGPLGKPVSLIEPCFLICEMKIKPYKPLGAVVRMKCENMWKAPSTMPVWQVETTQWLIMTIIRSQDMFKK